MSDSEDFRILAEELLDFVNGIEASCVKLRTQIDKLFGAKEEKPSYNIEKIRWEQAQGTSGPYEKSIDVNSLDFKALLADIQKHGGKMTVSGYFVWAFQNGSTLGRKKRQK